MDLTCPKCQGAMRSHERSGITVDQCGECRGIFLDRGELERLTDAETSFHATSGPAQPAYGSPAPGSQDRYRDSEYRDDRYRRNEYRESQYREQDKDRHRDDDHSRKRKKRSFLEELFD